MPTPSDEDALQRICEEVAKEITGAGLFCPGSFTIDFAKAVARRYAATVGAGVPEEVRRTFEAAKLQELFVDGDKADVYTKPPGSNFVNEFEMVARCACGELWRRRAVAIAVGLNWIGQRIDAEQAPAPPSP